MDLRFGIINNVDISKGLARVYFTDDNKTSSWIPMCVPFAIRHQASYPFDINEHVACIMDDNCEYGVIVGAIYDDNNLPKKATEGNVTIVLDDNSTIEYSRNAQSLTLDINGDIVIKSAKNVNIESVLKVNVKSPLVNVQGNVNITGTLAATSISTTNGGNMDVDGNINITGDATISGKSFNSHHHKLGTNDTTPPVL